MMSPHRLMLWHLHFILKYLCSWKKIGISLKILLKFLILNFRFFATHTNEPIDRWRSGEGRLAVPLWGPTTCRTTISRSGL